MARRNQIPANGNDLRGPQLAPPPLPATPPEFPVPGEEPGVGQSLGLPLVTRDQLAAMENVVGQLKIAVADLTIQSESILARRAELVAEVGAASGRYMQALRAAASGVGINPDDRERGWTFDAKAATFTRTK